MNNKFIWTLALLLVASSMSAFAVGVDKLQPLDDASRSSSYQNAVKSDIQKAKAKQGAVETSQSGGSVDFNSINTKTVYYPNATTKSIAAKYKMGNYSGCMQECYSLLKKQPNNAIAHYYLAMVFTHLNMKDKAVEEYNKVISIHPNQYLVDYATKGRDCLTDGPACHPQEQKEVEQLDDLDKFIRAPYGNGLSPELNNEVRQKQLNNIQETINKKDNLENRDIQRIKKFDSNKTEAEETIKIAQVSDDEVLKAINTLKEAGVNVSVQTSATENPYAAMAQYQDPRVAEMSMLLGNNNNNNNSMMNMIPMLMSQAQKGENIDPRIMQTMMMDSMMSGFNNLNNNNNNNY